MGWFFSLPYNVCSCGILRSKSQEKWSRCIRASERRVRCCLDDLCHVGGTSFCRQLLETWLKRQILTIDKVQGLAVRILKSS